MLANIGVCHVQQAYYDQTTKPANLDNAHLDVNMLT